MISGQAMALMAWGIPFRIRDLSSFGSSLTPVFIISLHFYMRALTFLAFMLLNYYHWKNWEK